MRIDSVTAPDPNTFGRHAGTRVAPTLAIDPSPTNPERTAMTRTPQDIFNHHLSALGGRDLDAIAEDYNEASVLITAERSYRGKREIRAFFSALLDTLPAADWALGCTTFEGQVLYIEWTAKSPAHHVDDGVDTFVFGDGMIATQTAHCSLVKTALNAL
jgi:hypothetical protein